MNRKINRKRTAKPMNAADYKRINKINRFKELVGTERHYNLEKLCSRINFIIDEIGPENADKIVNNYGTMEAIQILESVKTKNH
ncbi:MAG: hypothetical protein JW703_02915 [Candidatus Diapherotrites archaeon]|nr:hypothetical protein [Candidatus Diapherotrites archaeon]